MMQFLLIIALKALGGFTAAEAATLAPQIVTVIQTAASIYSALKAQGIDPLAALATVAKMVGQPHRMSPAEEKLWMDHASNVGEGGGG